ncbi:M96 mating-specific protein family [Phytophthora cinnamomi]|uniref:M96 mating-specific protein family n=2 Tax=Phytophthora cinnamomi TaxID=4785 RepID=UPI003559B15E|nr:M96 mating-specific protein family [Phytophthora cinnamomi]
MLDEFLTDESSDASSPRVPADLIAPVAVQPLTLSPPISAVTPSTTSATQPLLASPIPTPGQSPNHKKRRNYNPNKARDDLKRELTYLRGEAEELETKLHQLQSLKVAKTSDGSSASTRQITCNQNRTPFVWEQACARQLECRLRSERENAHLKMLLEGQVQVARSLEKLLNTRTNLHSSETSGSKRTTRIQVSRTGSEVVDAAVFEELADGVEASYRDVERVFESSGLELTNVSSRKAQMRDGKDGMLLEIFDSKVLPFSMHTTGEAWWRRWNHFNPNRGSCYRLESTDDTIVEHFGMEMSDSKAKTSAKFYVQQILRRYVEEDRVVVVWQSHIEPLEFSHKKLAGIRFREKGYVVIKPHEVSPADKDEAYTLVKTCHIIKPDLSLQKLKKDARTGALTEFVLSATVANIAASAEMIEGLLVDEALQQRSRM